MCAYQVDCARAHVRATTVTVVMDVDGIDDGLRLLSANGTVPRVWFSRSHASFPLPPVGPCGQWWHSNLLTLEILSGSRQQYVVA